MNVQIKNLAEPAGAESVCGFCARRWFGLVAYCPYCGRKPSFPTINQDPGDRVQSDEALATGQGRLWMPAGELNGPEAKSPRKEPFLRIDQESDNRRASDASGQGILGMPAGELHYEDAKSPRKEPFITIDQGSDDRRASDEALASGQGILGMPAGELHYQDAESPRKEPFMTLDQESDDRRASDGALTSGQGILGMPAGELHYQEVKSPRKEPLATSLEGLPILGETLPREGKTPIPSRSSKKALPLLFKTAAAGVGVLLLFWMVVKLPGPKTDERAPPQLSISSSGVARPSPGPSSPPPVPSIPLRTETAVAAGDQTVRQRERDAAQAAPQPNRRSLCSVANEAAGLCKP